MWGGEGNYTLISEQYQQKWGMSLIANWVVDMNKEYIVQVEEMAYCTAV